MTDDLDDALRADRRRTEARIAALQRDLDRIHAEVEVDPPDDEHDPDGATVGFERAQVAALLRGARQHLAEVDAARDRLAAGALGSCERCGAPIGDARLRARPTARTCVGCAS